MEFRGTCLCLHVSSGIRGDFHTVEDHLPSTFAVHAVMLFLEGHLLVMAVVLVFWVERHQESHHLHNLGSLYVVLLGLVAAGAGGLIRPFPLC